MFVLFLRHKINEPLENIIMKINVRKKSHIQYQQQEFKYEKLTEQQFQELEEKYSIFFLSKCFSKSRNLEEIDTFLRKYELEITMQERKEHLHLKNDIEDIKNI